MFGKETGCGIVFATDHGALDMTREVVLPLVKRWSPSAALKGERDFVKGSIKRKSFSS